MVDSPPSTPLVCVDRDVYLKCEFLHPGRSHKARVAAALIDDAERHVDLGPGSDRLLLERTGGNLGVALALEAQARGHRLTLVTDPHYAAAKRHLAARLGATVIDRGVAYPQCASNAEVIELLLDADPRYWYLNQFANPVNPKAHETSTGAEILSQLRAAGRSRHEPIVVVGGLGTGASMRGISRALRGWFDQVRTIAVQPPNCDLRTGRYGEHGVQGIAVGQPAPFFPVAELDGVIAVTDHDIAVAHTELLRRHRFLVGPSSAANLAAVTLARRHPVLKELRQPLSVTLLYDRGEDY